MTEEQTITHESHTPQFGIIIGSALVLAAVIFGGLFLWGKSVTPTGELQVQDARPTFEVMTSHVDEPNLTDAEAQRILEESDANAEQDTFE